MLAGTAYGNSLERNPQGTRNSIGQMLPTPSGCDKPEEKLFLPWDSGVRSLEFQFRA